MRNVTGSLPSRRSSDAWLRRRSHSMSAAANRPKPTQRALIPSDTLFDMAWSTPTSNYQELRKADPDRYSQLVAHAARIGMELGADVIKTQYTGSPETFERVVEATRPVPVVIAGGPLCSESEVLSAARGAITAGARGVSFGRNVFERKDPTHMLRLLQSAVHREGPLHS